MVVGAVQGIQGQERGQESARTHAHHRIRAIRSHSLFPTTTPPLLVQTKPDESFCQRGEKRVKRGKKLGKEVKGSNGFFPFPFKKKKSHFQIRFRHRHTNGRDKSLKKAVKKLGM